MLSGKEQYMELIWIIEKMFIENFGNDIKLVSMNECVNQMGYFRIQYKYIPLEYEIVFESERNLFCIDIYDKEGAKNSLYRIQKFKNETGEKNVESAIRLLKETLKKNEFNFYFHKDDKLYKKNKSGVTRVKDMKELLNG